MGNRENVPIYFATGLKTIFPVLLAGGFSDLGMVARWGGSDRPAPPSKASSKTRDRSGLTTREYKHPIFSSHSYQRDEAITDVTLTSFVVVWNYNLWMSGSDLAVVFNCLMYAPIDSYFGLRVTTSIPPGRYDSLLS
ncbi:hypothetical protein BDV37DRAFT_246959 [Aspergillus pseudonomiae]|uniref:Uncharacterized protein n=1 Tax=Aspergillus pseudonomiae TaxID=1506151 RepID=A0A5N7DFJ4_9EURO|nr:uncharacterized protein BDV37DRAFT_246959 [Aspergillus pseudonomiae]KAE8404783.1 hypothetical protein BDV37DRAFT_246959 [Aspergillus pseudonomiae]